MSVVESPTRGNVYMVNFDPARGSEQGGMRPAVVISGNAANRIWPVVTVASCSSQTDKYRSSPLVVLLPEGKPCRTETAVLSWQILTVSHERLGRQIGSLTEQQLADLKAKMRLVWELND